MDTIFTNFENSKTSDPHRLLLNLLDKINLKISYKCVVLSNLSTYYKCKNIKKSYKNNKFKVSAPTWNEDFELPAESYSLSDIQDCFEYILKKHETDADDPSIRIYVEFIEFHRLPKIYQGFWIFRSSGPIFLILISLFIISDT